MKGIGKLIRIGLVSMIVLSLFLSWKIWTNSGNTDIEKEAVMADNLAAKKGPDEVFLPVKMVVHDADGGHTYSNRESLLTNIHKVLRTFKLQKFVEMSEGNKEEYLDYQLRKNSYELVFSNPITFDYFFEINGMKLNGSMNKQTTFQRVVIAKDFNKIYFMDDNSYTVYGSSYKGDIGKMAQLVKEKDNRFIEVKAQKEMLPWVYAFPQPIKLKKYSYILATQSYTLFSKAFFDSEEEISSNEDNKNSKDVSLQNYGGENMTVQYTTGEVTFNGHFKEPKESEKVGNIYENTYQYVDAIANSLGTIRYFEKNDHTIVFRNYVEGYPVFSKDSKGRIEVYLYNKNVQIRTNQESIQVPIPSDEEVTLPTTESVINDLLDDGMPVEDIMDIQVGYTWETNDETKQVVDLSPEWYIKYKNVWETVPHVKQLFKDETDTIKEGA